MFSNVVTDISPHFAWLWKAEQGMRQPARYQPGWTISEESRRASAHSAKTQLTDRNVLARATARLVQLQRSAIFIDRALNHLNQLRQERHHFHRQSVPLLTELVELFSA